MRRKTERKKKCKEKDRTNIENLVFFLLVVIKDFYCCTTMKKKEEK
jgi:hypothetical protein